MRSPRAKERLFRLATWNCCRASVTKTADAVISLNAALTVLQEGRRPASIPEGQLWFGANPRNGVAVIPGPGVRIAAGPVAPAAPWSIVPLEVSGPLDLHVLMVWTRQEHQYIRGLDAALTTYAGFLQTAPAVVLGDFNANAIWDNARRPTDFSRVAARLAGEFGLVSAYHARSGEAFGSESQATHYFWRRRTRPFHLDYCFLPERWIESVRNVAILDGPPWDVLSDHRPLVIDVATRPARESLVL